MTDEKPPEVTDRWLAYWCGKCERREYRRAVRMCSKPMLRVDDFGELQCTRYKCEVMAV